MVAPVFTDEELDDRSRDEEVVRLLGLGAKLIEDFRKPDGTGWAVMIDIEGNEFCVERSPAERIATGVADAASGDVRRAGDGA